MDGHIWPVSFSGANGRDLLSGGGQVYNIFYGQDINELPGDLIVHNSIVPTRLNPNFGEVQYTLNDRFSNYDALILALQEDLADRSSMLPTPGHPHGTIPRCFRATSMSSVVRAFRLERAQPVFPDLEL